MAGISFFFNSHCNPFSSLTYDKEKGMLTLIGFLFWMKSSAFYWCSWILLKKERALIFSYSIMKMDIFHFVISLSLHLSGLDNLLFHAWTRMVNHASRKTQKLVNKEDQARTTLKIDIFCRREEERLEKQIHVVKLLLITNECCFSSDW